MEKIVFRIAKEFSESPGPRYIREGIYSGELFRTTIFSPLVKKCMKGGVKILVDLDGTYGYGTSFLEETFGGLIRNDKFRLDELNSLFEFKSEEEPYLIDEIKQYMEDEWQKQKGQKI
ncbi:hypothetical protein MASR1M107_05170 [Ignavibacteriales bacterium]